jgi:hypothetical protein
MTTLADRAKRLGLLDANLHQIFERVEQLEAQLAEQSEVLRAELAKPEPEPVAWAIVSNSTGEYYGVDLLVESCDNLVSHSGIDGYRNASVVPLYRKEDV